MENGKWKIVVQIHRENENKNENVCVRGACVYFGVLAKQIRTSKIIFYVLRGWVCELKPMMLAICFIHNVCTQSNRTSAFRHLWFAPNEISLTLEEFKRPKIGIQIRCCLWMPCLWIKAFGNHPWGRCPWVYVPFGQFHYSCSPNKNIRCFATRTNVHYCLVSIRSPH